MAFVELNGNRYVLDGPLKVSYVPMQSQPLRLTGVTLRENDPTLGHYIFRGFPQGVGWSRMNRQNGRGVQGLTDSTADTRFLPVTGGRLHEAQTHAAPLDHIRAYANFNSNYYGLFEQDYASGALTCLCVTAFGGSNDTWAAVDTPMFNAATERTAVIITSGGGSITFSHTVQATYGNRLIVVITSSRRDAGGAYPSAVTYGGVSMTSVTSATSGDAANTQLWRLVAPATGANDVVVTVPAGSASSYHTVHAMDFYFVNQTTPFGTAQNATATATSTSVGAVTTSSGDLVVGGASHVANEATAVGASLVEVLDTAATLSQESSYGRAVTTTFTWAASWTTNSVYVAVAAPILSDGFVAAPETTVAAGVRGWDMKTHKGTLVILASRGGSTELQFQVFSSTDGDTFTPYTNLPAGATSLLTTTITRRNNFDDEEGKLLDFANLLIAAVYDGVTNSRINVYSTNDVGGTAWTAQGNIPNRYVHALLQWRDPSALENIIPVLVTEYNVYRIDTTNNRLDPLLPQGVLGGDANDGRGATVGTDGNLYLPLSTGRLLKVRIVDTNVLDIVDIGPPEDGFIAARRGHVNRLLTVPEKWLIVAYGGHIAGQQASIWAVDYEPQKNPETGKEYHAWHSLYYEGDANIDLYALGYSTEDDSTPRLHFGLESATSSEMFHLEEPFAHPSSGASIKYQASTLIQTPTDDLGDPHATATFFTARVDADDLSTSTAGEYIQLRYGLDGASAATTLLGNFLSGTKSLNFGTSGVGVAGTKIAWLCTILRDAADNTQIPKLFELEILAENRLVFKRSYSFVISIEGTKREQAPTLVANTAVQETIIDNLETVAEATTLLTFRTGQDAETLVRVPNDRPPVFDLETVGSAGRQRGYRTGTVQIYLEEAR